MSYRSGSMSAVDAGAFAVLMPVPAYAAALVAAGWVIVPVAAFGGWYHERARRAAD